jgi:DNA-binding CsgD family transcriptional regulator
MPTLGPRMEQSFAGLLDALDQCGNRDEIWRVGTKWLNASGVSWCHYAYTSNRIEPPQGRLCRYTSLPQAWLDHYAAQAFFRVDPAVRHCARASTPILTSLEPPERSSVGTWRMWEDAIAVGFGCGVAVPLRRPGAEIGGFSLITAMSGSEFLAWHKSVGRWATLAAHVIDQRFLTLAEPTTLRPLLSVRERECLTWLAVGLRHDRIAERLGISRPTVELHLANARRKLAARTREQALARAVALSLLHL